MSTEEIVRSGESPPKPQGYRQPSTAGINKDQAAPSLSAMPPRQTSQFLRSSAENDLNRWLLYGAAVVAIEEVASVPIPAAGTFIIDPNKFLIWNLNVAGSNLQLDFTSLAQVPVSQSGSLLYGARRVRTLELVINWLEDGTRTVAMTGVKTPGGEPIGWTNVIGTDVVLIQVDTAGNKYAFPAGMNMKVPS